MNGSAASPRSCLGTHHTLMQTLRTKQPLCISFTRKEEVGRSLFLFVFSRPVSLCIPGCPGVHAVDQDDLELTEVCLTASLSAGSKGVCRHHHWLEAQFFTFILCAQATSEVWRSKDNLQQIALLFYHMGTCKVQLVRLNCRFPYALSHVTIPNQGDLSTVDSSSKHKLIISHKRWRHGLYSLYVLDT